MDFIELIQKAKALKEKGFDSYQGVIANYGVVRANEILGNLLEAFELGFNLDDLNTLFKNINFSTDKKSEEVIVQEDTALVVEETAPVEDNALWGLLKEKFKYSLDIEKFVNAYENPSHPTLLDLEDLLLCLGVDNKQASSKMKGFAPTINTHLAMLNYDRKINVSTLNSFNPSQRNLIDKSSQSVKDVLGFLGVKRFLLEYEPLEPSFKTLNDWLNVRYTIERNGQVEQWFLPDYLYEELSNNVNSLLIKYNIQGDYLLKSYLSKEEFTPADALDVNKGFCEIVYRDAILALYNKEASFPKIVKDFCSMKGHTYTKEFEDHIYTCALSTTVNNMFFKPALRTTVRPFHQLVLFHILEKETTEPKKLKIDRLFP